MKNIFIIIIGLFVFSCAEKKFKIYNTSILKDTININTINIVDSTDLLIIKTKSLIDSTKNTDKKVKQIKKIVAENKQLKEEILCVKKERDDLIQEVNTQKHKNIFQRVIEAIKDTTIK